MDLNVPAPLPKWSVALSAEIGHGCRRPPKAKNLLDATVKQAMTGMPMARGHPPKKARTTKYAASPALAPKTTPAHAPTPASDGSAIKAKNTKYCVSVIAKINKDRDDASIEDKDISFLLVINIMNVFADDDSLTPFFFVMLFLLT
jgi:hypothetical protein